MKNNKAMVLYDALLSFIVLSSVVFVFISTLELDLKLLNETKTKILILDKLKEASANGYPSIKKNGYTSKEYNDNRYCIYYDSDRIEYCVFK